MSETDSGTLEARADAGDGKPGVVKYWLDAIAIASDDEEKWRQDAQDTEAIYKGGDERSAGSARHWNILYSNVETISAAVYNSAPVPDIRERYSDGDPSAKEAARVIERCLSFSLDEYDIDATFGAMVIDACVVGRGLVRVKYVHTEADERVVSEAVSSERVDWTCFRRGAAKRWEDVPWIAFQHFLTRAAVKKLNPAVGATMNLDAALAHSEKDRGDGSPPHDVFKRAEVWEIWDKDRREVVFIAPGHKSGPLATVPDPLGLAEFFPCPRPLQPIKISGSLVPVEPFRLYRKLADELNILTRRCQSLIRAIRWRGAYFDLTESNFLNRFKDLEDGDMTPIDNPAMASGGLDKAFWFQPIEQAAKVLVQLYEAREQTKQAIYEVTGISDILRGASAPSETATAQGIKAQWGSLRISSLQAEVQRMARDVLRMKTEIIAEKFSPQTLQQMSGIPITEEVYEVLKTDTLRRYRVDVETDSTIRADLQRQQQNVTGFVQGFGAFIQAVGPAVQAGALPMEVVGEMVRSFSRVFKLGRGVEEAMGKLPTQVPPQADPNAGKAQEMQAAQQAEAMKMQAAAQTEDKKLAAAAQLKQMEIAATAEAKQADIMLEVEKMKLAEAGAERAHSLAMSELHLKAAGVAISQQKQEDDVRRTDSDINKASRETASMDMDTEEKAGSVAASAAMVDAQKKMAEVLKRMGAPKKIVRGPDGKASAIETEGVGVTHRVVRGPDGRATGIEGVN